MRGRIRVWEILNGLSPGPELDEVVGALIAPDQSPQPYSTSEDAASALLSTLRRAGHQVHVVQYPRPIIPPPIFGPNGKVTVGEPHYARIDTTPAASWFPDGKRLDSTVSAAGATVEIALCRVAVMISLGFQALASFQAHPETFSLIFRQDRTYVTTPG